MGDEAEGEVGAMVTLVAEGRRFRCHRAQLVAASDYFRAMFSTNFTEHDKHTVELQGIDADCLMILVEYVESGSYTISSESVLPLLQTAAMLQFTNIQSACEQNILTTLSSASCLEIYFVTSTLGLYNIASSALTIAVWKFSDIVHTPQFTNLSVREVLEYISHPALYLEPVGEWKVLESIMMWIEVNEAERAEHLVQLLLCLDFHSLTNDDLANILFYSTVSENNQATQVIEYVKRHKKRSKRKRYPWEIESEERKGREEEAMSAGLCSKQGVGDQVLCSSSRLMQGQVPTDTEMEEELKARVEAALDRGKRKIPQLPCVVGFKRSQHSAHHRKNQKAKLSDDEGEDTRREYSQSTWVRNLELVPVIYSFSAATRKVTEELVLSKLCEGPIHCSGYQVVSVGPSVYLLGGEFQLGQGNWNTSLWRYSTATKKWICESSLPRPRRHQMACVLGTEIYLVGGYGRHRVIQSSVDIYDTDAGEWIRCPDMPHVISQGAVCGFRGRVMVFTQEMQLLTYYPTMKKWSAIPLRSPNKLGYRAALPWNDHIYLIDNCSSHVYKFSPEAGQTITVFGCFTAPPVNVCLVDGRLYSFSHDDLEDYHVIEVLDTGDDGGDPGCGESQLQGEESSGGQHCHKNGVSGGGGGHNKLVKAAEVWRKQDSDTFLFTTKCPAEATFSFGAFPLLKL